MDITLQLDNQVRQKLKDQELSLQNISDDEIQIIGNPRKQLVAKLLFALAGIVIVAFSMIFARGQGTNSLILMIAGSLVGLLLITMPLYNFYSKRQFRILISRKEKTVVLRSIRSTRAFNFSEIENLGMKIFKMDDYVSDETEGSTTFHCRFFLHLQDSSEADLFTFSSRNKNDLEKFSETYAQYLAKFMSVPFNKVMK